MSLRARTISRCGAAALGLAVSVATAPAQTPAPLAWLAGCWQTQSGGTRETWVAEPGGYLFGHAVTIRDGATVFFEHLRIEPPASGALSASMTFVAYPRGGRPTRFAQTAEGPGWVRFENPDHDFPQRITYRRDGGTLNAEAATLDEARASRWVYTSCGED